MKLLIPALLCSFIACADDKAQNKKTSSVPKPEEAVADPVAERVENPDSAEPEVSAEYAEDMDRICNAMKYSGAEEFKDPSERIIRAAQWLKKNLETREATTLMDNFASIAPDQRQEFLLAEAKEAGLDSCALADNGGQ